MKQSEFDQCVRELQSLEQFLAKNPKDVEKWVLRSEIYNHLQRNSANYHATTEQLFFGAFVAGLSDHQAIKAAYSYSFLSAPHFKKLREISKDLDTEADT